MAPTATGHALFAQSREHAMGFRCNTSIQVRSDREGKGAGFTVRLPRRSA